MIAPHRFAVGALTPSIFTTDQLTPKWIADGSPSTTIIAKGTGGDWDLYIREIGNVIDEGVAGSQRYKLTYTGHNDATYDETTATTIGWAYSSDGVNWTKGGQLITARNLEDPWVIKYNGVYYLYAEDKTDTVDRNIRLYTSTDFVTWTDQGDVLSVGAASSWEDLDVSSPVVWVEGSTWKMLYEGRKVSTNLGNIGLATSTDGITWTKDPSNPVFSGGDFGWHTEVVPDDIILANDGTYVLLYHGNDGTFFRGAVAHSTDLYTWTDPLDNVSTRIDMSSAADAFTMQFHPIGSNINIVHARNSGAGIVQGVDMGYEVLVTNFTGSNGSTSFTDESAWGHTLTANGNAQIQSSKLELDGTGDYVSIPDNNRWTIGTLPYTLELFGVAFDSNTSLMTLVAQWGNSTVATEAYRFDYRGDLATDILRVLGSTGGATFSDDSSAWTPTVSTSYNLCFERSGTTLRFYVNGSMLSSTTQSESFNNPSASFLIGANQNTGSAGGFLDGRMSAIRFTNGKALYASNSGYSVPSLPLVPSN